MGNWSDQNKQDTVINGSIFDAAGTTQKNEIGKRCQLSDGRVFRYAKAAGTITVGDAVVNTVNSQAIAATYFGLTAAVAPIGGEGGTAGDQKVRLSADVTGVTVDEYAGGYLCITNDTGEGEMYRIKSNEASGSAGVGSLIEIHDGIRTALDNTSVGIMISNEYSAVKVHTAADPNVENCVGKAVVGATSGQYLWVQTWGVALMQAGVATVDVGEQVILAEDDNGSVQVGLAENVQVIGYGIADIADTIWGPVFLQINP